MDALNLTEEEARTQLDQLQTEYAAIKARDLTLNMARGKPSAEQLDLSMPLLDVLNADCDFHAEDGTDCRNYGIGFGIPEARRLMASMLNDDPEQVIVCGNASLNIMYDMVARLWMFGTQGNTPWSKLESVSWLCPVPGYDRHFGITEAFGIKMINIDLHEDGPDMDMVEKLVAEDESIKGIWCVPQYSNPTGITYSDETVTRLARMNCAAQDFRIFWDNAYCVHHLFDEERQREHVMDIAQACKDAGNEERYYKFASTSKITFPGAGLAAIAASKANIAEIKPRMNVQTIGHDKLNQLRHVRFLKDAAGIDEHMKKHAALIRPKFEAVLSTLDSELSGWGCSWTNPVGGYFISFTGPENTAKRIVSLAGQAGVTLTGAGAPFPYGQDPNDNVIRLSPTLPSLEEIKEAIKVFTCCAKIACLEKALAAN